MACAIWYEHKLNKALIEHCLTLADIVAVCSISFIFCRHHDVPGCHPSLGLQAKSLHAAAETNTEALATSQGGCHRELYLCWFCGINDVTLCCFTVCYSQLCCCALIQRITVMKKERQKCKIMFETKGKQVLLIQLSSEARLLRINLRGKSYRRG